MDTYIVLINKKMPTLHNCNGCLLIITQTHYLLKKEKKINKLQMTNPYLVTTNTRKENHKLKNTSIKFKFCKRA